MSFKQLVKTGKDWHKKMHYGQYAPTPTSEKASGMKKSFLKWANSKLIKSLVI